MTDVEQKQRLEALESQYAVDDRFKFDKFVVVDGLPVVTQPAKVEALTKVLTKVFTKVGPLAEKTGFHLPTNDEGHTVGYAFLEYKTSEGASNAVKAYNNKKLDAKHTMQVDRIALIPKFTDGSDAPAYKEPQVPAFKPLPHFRSWLTDSLGRDQAVLHIGDDVDVCWFRKDSAPQIAVHRERLTEAYVQWSPLGTYLLSVHRQGVALHAGPNLDIVARFPHRDARLVDFSPDEKYLVTGSREPIPTPPEDAQQRAQWPFKETDEGNNIVVWSVESHAPLRTFPLPPPPPGIAPGAPMPPPVWPAFKWSSDSRYFARIAGPDTLSIYEAPSMSLVDKKSMKIPGIMDFSFAPATIGGKQLLAYWTPEMPNQTARVCIMDVATKVTVRNRSLFNVVRCNFYWQNEGAFLCVKIDRLTKNKKHIFSSLEIYRMREKSFPVEVIDLKEIVLDFAWEPRGDRFAVISYFEAAQAPQPPSPPTEPPNLPNTSKNVLSFYALERTKGLQGTWKEANRLKDRGTNALFWSPRGRFIVTAQLKASKPLLEFWDIDYEGSASETQAGATSAAKDLPVNVSLVSSVEQFGVTDLAWDPSGRYIVSVSTARIGMVSAGGGEGFRLWDITGHQLREESLDQFKAFMWRPRPVSLLTKEKRKEISSTVKKYAPEFDLEDETLASAENIERQEQRDKMVSEWFAWRESLRAPLAEFGVVPEEDRLVVKNGEVFVVQSSVVEEEEEEEVE